MRSGHWWERAAEWVRWNKVEASAWAVALLLAALLALQARAVEPLHATYTNALSDANGAQVDPGTLYWGTELVLTNCACLDAGGDPQNLSNVTVWVCLTLTNSLTQTNVASLIDDGTGGLWWVAITVPTNMSSFYLQTRLNTNELIYPKKLMSAEAVL